jgi:peptidoglycan-associated lipoprotein
MKMTPLALLAIVVGAAALGCGSDPKKKTTPTPPVAKAEKPKADTKQLEQLPKNEQVSPNLSINSDIVKLCGIKAAATANPTFDYDKEELTPEDRAVLDQLATCMMTGALKGKAVSLICRADPRGTEEYNLSLGSRRSGSVSTYLEHLGVQQVQLAVTTRGALDATGTDEAGWSKDRRVDVLLKVD